MTDLTTNMMFSGQNFAILAMFLLDQVVKLVDEGSVINGPTPSSFYHGLDVSQAMVITPPIRDLTD